MPGTLRLLVAAADPADPDVVYGAGHKMDFVSEDEDWVQELRREGKAEILEYTPPAATRASREEESKKKG